MRRGSCCKLSPVLSCMQHNMNITELFESPQLIGSLNSDEVNAAILFCIIHLADAKKLESVTKNITLYELTQPGGGYFFLYDSARTDILYFARYKKVDFSTKVLPMVGVRQVLLWKNRTIASAATAGFAKKVFWEYLFPKFNVLVSDTQQTEDGRNFWSAAVQVALDEKNLRVRLIDTNDNTFEDFTDKRAFIEAEARIWGKKRWFQRKIVAIFKE